MDEIASQFSIYMINIDNKAKMTRHITPFKNNLLSLPHKLIASTSTRAACMNIETINIKQAFLYDKSLYLIFRRTANILYGPDMN